MLISVEGNMFCLCMITGSPQYAEEFGAYKSELTRVYAKAKQTTPDGVQTVNLTLYFWDSMAIPAMKLKPGSQIVVTGRTMSQNRIVREKMTLETMVAVEWWTPRETDPMGMLDELKARREIGERRNELKILFAQYLTECKGAILGWVADWFKEKMEAARLKKEGGNDGKTE